MNTQDKLSQALLGVGIVGLLIMALHLWATSESGKRFKKRRQEARSRRS
jgi:hypothetical protein